MTKKTGLDRRTILKTAGTALTTTGLTAGLGTASDGQKAKFKFKLRGGKGKPVKKKQIRRRRRNAIRQFVRQTGPETKPALVGLDDKDTILAYNFIATEGSGVSEHFYTADLSDKEITIPAEGNAEGVTKTTVSSQGKGIEKRAHSAADGWFEAEATPDTTGDVSTADGVSTDGVTTSSGQPDFSTWYDRQDLYHTNEKPPYGIIIEQYALKESPDQDDVFGVRTGVDIEAGENQAEYGDEDYKVPSHPTGAYQIRNAEVKHDWNTVISESDSMRDRAPRGKLSDGTQSFGISLGIDSQGVGSAGFSYGYSSQADKVIDESSQSDNIGRWKLKTGSKSYASDNNAYYNPASLAILHPENSETCDLYPWQDMKIVDLPLDVTFCLTSLYDQVFKVGGNQNVSLGEDFFLPCP
jgi:hypothetical protein